MTDWTVYILRCSDNSLYTGITRDLNRRLDEHNKNNRLASAYTRAHRPVKLIYQETHLNRSSASKHEANIKNMTKVEKERLITEQHGKFQFKKCKKYRTSKGKQSQTLEIGLALHAPLSWQTHTGVYFLDLGIDHPVGNAGRNAIRH